MSKYVANHKLIKCHDAPVDVVNSFQKGAFDEK